MDDNFVPETGEEVDAEQQAKKPITPKVVIREIASWFAWIAGAVLLAVFISQALIVNARVISGSMENTIMTNDRVVGLRTAYWFSSPSRFDVVVFNNPTVDDNFNHPGVIRRMTVFVTNPLRRQHNRVIFPEPYVKRVIGLPGETVEIRGGYVYINGARLEGDVFARGPGSRMGDHPPVVVPEGHFFVLGDNRNNSSDSRNWGMLERGEIIGRINFGIRPGLNFYTMR